MSHELRKLVILHTNDLHSQFENMPKIAALIAQEKSRCLPDQVLTVDCGDHMDRMRPETEGTDGLANIAVMNETGYEAFVPGNNEGLTFPPHVLEPVFAEHARFDVIASNVTELASGKVPSWMLPSRIVDKNGIRVGLIGVSASFNKFYNLLGWHLADPIETVRRMVSEMRSSSDLIVVLSHIGISLDRRMAEEVDGIHLILGGHTHHLLEKPICLNNTYICAAGKLGDHVGKVEVIFDKRRLAVTSINASCIEVRGIEDHLPVMELIQQYKRRADQKLGAVVGRLDHDLTIHYDKESELGNLLASGVRKRTGASIGLVNSGQILRSLSAGNITREILLEVCPSPINPCRMQLKGALLLRALEESLLREFTNMPIRGFGFRGEKLGNLCVDGADIIYDPGQKPYEKILDVWVAGESLNPEKEYDVGCLDMFTFGVGYMSLKEGNHIQYFLPEFIRDILSEQLNDSGELRRSQSSRWHRK